MHGSGISPQSQQSDVACGELVGGETPAVFTDDDARRAVVPLHAMARDPVDQCGHRYPKSFDTF